MSEVSELAGTAGAISAWARKLQDAVRLVEEAHALEGQIGGLAQQIEAKRAELAAADEEAKTRARQRDAEENAARQRIATLNAEAETHARRNAETKAAADQEAAQIVEAARQAARQAEERHQARLVVLELEETEARARAEAAVKAADEVRGVLLEEQAKLDAVRKAAALIAGR